MATRDPRAERAVEEDETMGGIFVAAGAFAIAGAVMNGVWFMLNRKARIWMKLFGRTGTRIFYVPLGTALVTLGVLFVTGTIPLNSR